MQIYVDTFIYQKQLLFFIYIFLFLYIFEFLGSQYCAKFSYSPLEIEFDFLRWLRKSLD